MNPNRRTIRKKKAQTRSHIEKVSDIGIGFVFMNINHPFIISRKKEEKKKTKNQTLYSIFYVYNYPRQEDWIVCPFLSVNKSDNSMGRINSCPSTQKRFSKKDLTLFYTRNEKPIGN